MCLVVATEDSTVPHHYEGLCVKVGRENGISLNNSLALFRYRVSGLLPLSWVLQVLRAISCFACFSPNPHDTPPICLLTL